MISLDVVINDRKARKRLTDLQRSQIPFALSQALNQTMIGAQQFIRRKEFVRVFEQRNKKFPELITTIPRGKFATKRKLEVTMLNVRGAGEGFIDRQIRGRKKTARGSNIAIPVIGPGLRRGASGAIPKAKRPANDPSLVRIGRVLYQRQKRKGLVPRFVLTPQARPSSRGRFRYYEVAEEYIRRRMQRNWDRAFASALKTAR